MIEDSHGDRVLKMVVAVLYALPFLHEFGPFLIAFVKEWDALIGSALGAGIGAAGALYIGRRSNLAALDAAMRQTKGQILTQEFVALQNRQTNLNHHIVVIRALVANIENKFNFFEAARKPGANAGGLVVMAVAFAPIKIPEMLDVTRFDFNSDGYGDELGTLRILLEGTQELIGKMSKCQRACAENVKFAPSFVNSLYEASSACLKIGKPLIQRLSNQDIILRAQMYLRQNELREVRGFDDVFEPTIKFPDSNRTNAQPTSP